MEFKGSIRFDEPTKLYVIKLPVLDAHTQCEKKDEVFEYIHDYMDMIDPEIKFDLSWVKGSENEFVLVPLDVKKFIGLVLKRHRKDSHLSMNDLVSKQGFSSRNSIYTYENGTSEPSLSKLWGMLDAMGYSLDLTINRK